jgi:RNA polymerase sigma factor (sigma-70 family)
MTRDGRTTVIQGWLDQLNAGNESAREALFASALARLTRLARRMLRDFHRVARWEQADDVLQNALVRLDRSLRAVRPRTAKDFFRLAAAQIRRELIDLARHYFGPAGAAAHHSTRQRSGEHHGATAPDVEPPDTSHDPARLAAWTDFHAQIALLADDDRELFDLLWYHGLTQAEVGTVLNVSERTVNKRWIAARLKLADALGGQLPN